MTMCVSDYLCVTHVLPHINVLRIIHYLVDLTTKQNIVVKFGKQRRKRRRRRRRRRSRRRRRRRRRKSRRRRRRRRRRGMMNDDR